MIGSVDDPEPNDPTRSGPPLLQADGAWLSHNEIEQLCLKAARGAGMSWGLAEEAGFAAAWLARRDVDGPAAILSQITHADARSWHEICPEVTAGQVTARDGQELCPIALGTVLCDHGNNFIGSKQEPLLSVGPITYPVLLLPFLSDISKLCALSISLEWSGRRVFVGPNGEVTGDIPALESEPSIHAQIKVGSGPKPANANALRAFFVSEDTLSGLNRYALRTTVPASEMSRAGAGADDAD